MARAIQVRHLPLGWALLLTVLASSVSQAQTVTWDGSAGNGDFNTASNWTPSGVPDSTESALIALDQTVTTSAASRVEHLTLSGGAWLMLGSTGNVIVDSSTLLDKTTAESVQLFVQNTSAAIDFDTNSLNILNGAEVDMEGGLLQIDNLAEIFPGSSITGHGIIEFTGSTVGDGLDNGGTIRPDGGTLTLRSTPSSNARLGTALDGEVGSYIVTSGSSDLVIDVPSNQQYPGVVEVGDGNSISFNQGWYFGRLATIDLTGGALGPATLGGDEIEFSGVMVVEGAGEVTANWTCDGFSGIFVTAGSTLTLRGHTFFSAAVLDGDGTMVLEGTMKVGTDRIWTATEFRTGSLTEIAAAFGVRLDDPSLLAGGDFFGNSRITFADEVSVTGLTVFDCRATFEATSDPVIAPSGLLIFNEAVVLEGSGFAGASFSGQGTVVFNDEVSVQGESQISSPSSFGGASQLEVVSGARLSLIGPTFLAGGDLIGGGTLAVHDTANVTNTTTINVATLDMDGPSSAAWTVSSGQTLTIQSQTLDVGNDTFNGTLNLNGANLEVNVLDGNWEMAGTLNLTQTSGFTGNVAAGAVLNVTGVVNTSGEAAIGSPVAFGSSAVVNVPAASRLLLSSITSFAGGAYTGAGEIQTNGLTAFTGSTTIGVSRFDLDGSEAATVSIGAGATVTFNVANLDDGNNTFNGTLTNSGAMQVNASTGPWAIGSGGKLSLFTAGSAISGSSALNVNNGGLLDGRGAVQVALTNSGRVAPGLTSNEGHTLTLTAGFTQAAGGVLEVDLVSAGLYDRLDVAGLATLSGLLDVDYEAGFQPAAGNVFRVLDFDSRSGAFLDFVDLSFGPGGGQFLAPIWRTDHLSLYCPLAGDANLDGQVSGADYTLWADNFGGPGAQWAQGDFNGDGLVTGADYTLWADHFGQSVNLSPAIAAPEPQTWALALLGAAALLGGRSRRLFSL